MRVSRQVEVDELASVIRPDVSGKVQSSHSWSCRRVSWPCAPLMTPRCLLPQTITMSLGTISTSGEIRELDQEGSWQSIAFIATILIAAFVPVGLTVGAQVLEVYKQLSKRMDVYDDDDEEEEKAAKAAKDGGGDVTTFSNPVQADDDDDGGAEAVAAKGGDDGNAMKISNPLQEVVGDATPVQASLGDAAPDKASLGDAAPDKAAAVLSSE